jgi:GxxExxY protein
MHENEIAQIVVDASFKIHSRLGPGLLESVYRIILWHELRKRGMSVEKEVPVALQWDSLQFEEGFRADLIVERKVVIEVKAIAELAPVHKRQLLTYLLQLTDCKLGLLTNFGEERIKNGTVRVVNRLDEDAPSPPLAT